MDDDASQANSSDDDSEPEEALTPVPGLRQVAKAVYCGTVTVIDDMVGCNAALLRVMIRRWILFIFSEGLFGLWNILHVLARLVMALRRGLGIFYLRRGHWKKRQ